MSEHDDDQPQKPEPIRLNIPPRFLHVPAAAFVVGSAIGILRGGRAASLRFLAENAHRPPTTVQGWYFYKKTKNYKVMLGGLKGAGKEASRLTLLALGYVGLEEGMERSGWGRIKEIGAGGGTAAAFSVLNRLPVALAGRTIVLGLIVGSGLAGIRYGREEAAGRFG